MSFPNILSLSLCLCGPILTTEAADNGPTPERRQHIASCLYLPIGSEQLHQLAAQCSVDELLTLLTSDKAALRQGSARLLGIRHTAVDAQALITQLISLQDIKPNDWLLLHYWHVN